MKVHPVTHAKRMLPAAVALMSGAFPVSCDAPQRSEDKQAVEATVDSSRNCNQAEHVFRVIPYDKQRQYSGGAPAKKRYVSQPIPGVIVKTPIPIINPPFNIDIIEPEPISEEEPPVFDEGIPF